MSNWQETLFTELLIESKDGEWGKGENTVGLEEVEVIRGTDFIKINNPQTILPVRWVKSEIVQRKRLYIGDILIETAGGTANQSTGRTALLKQSFFEKHNQRPVLCASFSRFLRIKKGKYNPIFIYYLLQGLYEAGYMGIYNLQHTGISRFQYTTFKNKTVLKIPPLPIQKKIAAILSAYDDLIENNNRRIAILEKMAEEIYHEWFVRLRFPGHEQVKFNKGIPEGWEFLKIESICKEIRNGVKIKNLDGSTKYLGLEHLPRKSILIKDFDTADSVKSDKLLFKDRDILFGKIRPYLHKIVLANFSGACSSDTIVIRPKSKEYEGFLLFTIFSDTFIELAAISSKGTKMPRADWDFLKKLQILLPDKKTLTLYQNKFDNLFSLMCKYASSNNILKQTRDRLLTRLISGKLSVEDLDIQFPPSMTEELE